MPGRALSAPAAEPLASYNSACERVIPAPIIPVRSVAPLPPRIELLLTRHAETAWSAVIRPWLEAGRGRLERAYVVVPTRGQAHGLKQRCLSENVPLLGIEFLTPGLARKKWMALSDAPAAARPAIGRELLLLGLRARLEQRLAALQADEPAWGLWKSLQSDPERALDDFDELLKAGFGPEHFALEPLRDVFGELVHWVDSLGYAFASRQNETAARTPVGPDEPRIGGRLLVHGLSAEAWGEFFNVAALARRCDRLTVVLPEPQFRGRKALDEAWIDLWAALLGVEAQSVDAPEPAEHGAAVAALWHAGAPAAARVDAKLLPVKLVVGRTRADEMALVADELGRLLAAGAEEIAVVFPRADAAHLRLARLLEERGVPFVDLLENAGQPPVDVQLQRALLAFHENGGRLEDLLALWPLLTALSFTEVPLGAARDVCERLFDERQTHAAAAYAEMLAASERPEWREVARIAAILTPWPAELTLADALARFEALCAEFFLPLPPGWTALQRFGEHEKSLLPMSVVVATLATFLPEKSPAPAAPGKGLFARVTLTTRRRAEGLAWSHVVFVESNAGIWPERRESSCWLTDDHREALSRSGRYSLGVFTGEDRATLEKAGYAALARDTSRELIFSAALFDLEEPELKLAPNSWLERVMVERGLLADRGLEDAFARLAIEAAPQFPPPAKSISTWLEIWQRRRDPVHPFDEYFFSARPDAVRPERLAARQIERAVQDPAELWFEAILGVHRVDWVPLARARKKALGSLAHRVLAAALRPVGEQGRFGALPAPAQAQARLTQALGRLRARWPQDRYWDSFSAELTQIARTLLDAVFVQFSDRPFVGVEIPLPRGATVPLGPGGGRLVVHGRMDLALLDRPEWGGAAVDVVDFKTGTDAKLAIDRMARTGASLQLGIYLAAIESLGVRDGRVWMLKPGNGPAGSVGLEELPQALAPLAQLGRHLSTGCYGALTPDRNEYSASGDSWPLACTPIPAATLAAKFAATFGARAEAEATDNE